MTLTTAGARTLRKADALADAAVAELLTRGLAPLIEQRPAPAPA